MAGKPATFFNRNSMDLALFVFVTAVQDTMHTISDKSAIDRFQKKFGKVCEDCPEDTLYRRLKSMREAYTETLRTL